MTDSLTPPMHERMGADLGLLYLYRPIDSATLGITQKDLPRLLESARQLGFNALNITHPFKQSVVNVLDIVTPDAQALGAVNTVIFRDGQAVGFNTDFSGYLTGLNRQLSNPDSSRVVVLGAGGAGAATAYGLLRDGAEEVCLIDTDHDRGRQLAIRLQTTFPEQRVFARPHGRLELELATATGFAHCTPMGMTLHPGTPVNVDWLPQDCWVSEAVYIPQQTPLVTAARARGITVVDGTGMAVGQALDSFELITGIAPDPDRMLEHFQALTREKGLA